MLVIFLVLAPAAKHIPMSALAAILFVIAYGLIDWRSFLRMVRSTRPDATVCATTFLSTLFIPLTYAIYVGIFLNIALYLHRTSRLHLQEMVATSAGPFLERPIQDKHGNQRVMFLQIEGDLFFGVAEELQDRLNELAASPIKIIIFRMKRTHSIDTTIMTILEQFVQRMHEHDGHVILCGIKPALMRSITSFGLAKLVGDANVFETTYGVFTSAKRALHRARELVGASIDTDNIPIDDEPASWAYEI